MFSSLATKIVLKKAGISSDSFKLPWDDASQKSSRSSAPPFDTNDDKSAWPAWLTVKNLPLTVQPWLTPIPPPVAVSPPPQIGQPAPLDRDRELTFGNGKRTIVVFLRCVGCACTSSHNPPPPPPPVPSPLTCRNAVAQKTFLQLRAIATRFPNDVTCLAVSHSSAAATQKWVSLLGGAWNVGVVVDEDRAVYAAWGLGLGSVWYVLNPTSTVAGFKEKGWLGASVAGSLQRSGAWKPGAGAAAAGSIATGNGAGVVGSDLEGDGPATVMGNKWQESGAWAVDGRGKVVWGGKAARADDVMDLEEGVKALGL